MNECHNENNYWAYIEQLTYCDSLISSGTSVEKQLHSKSIHNKKALILNSEWMCPV